MIPLAVTIVLLTLLMLTLGTPLPCKVMNEEETNCENKKNTLRLVTVIMRHGERAPVDSYPNDPYIKDDMEPYGWGQLTNVIFASLPFLFKHYIFLSSN